MYSYMLTDVNLMYMYISCSIAIELGYVETTPNDTLHSLRPKIEQLFAKQSASSSACKPAERVWRFLDGKCTIPQPLIVSWLREGEG